jgi:hypothetical protein
MKSELWVLSKTWLLAVLPSQPGSIYRNSMSSEQTVQNILQDLTLLVSVLYM